MDNTLFLNKKDIKYCTNFFSRLKGMMFNRNKENYIFCFPKCNSVHTFFMLKNIDIIMTDRNNKIIKIYQNIRPWKILLPKKNVYYTYEFNNNIIKNIKNYKNIIIK